MDAFTVSSHREAAEVWDSGRPDARIAPLDGVTRDECVRPDSTTETLAGLRSAHHDPVFAERFPRIEWNVTAGDAGPVDDGASAVLVTPSGTAARLGPRPPGRPHSFAATGSAPPLMLTGVVPATGKVLRRAGLSLDDIDLFEVNEALSGADPARGSVHGGAPALGHPLGAGGARLTTTPVHAMRGRGARYALRTMREAGGLADATVLERV